MLGTNPALSPSEAVFDLGRVHVLERGDLVLVIDRISGRWVMMAHTSKVGLELLGAAASTIPEHLRESVAALRRTLAERGVGVAGPAHERPFNTLILKLTKACNLACSYCYDFEPLDKAAHMDAERAVETVRQAVDLAEGPLHLILHGGEPMLAWDLLEQVVLEARSRAASAGIELRIMGQTNLTRLSEDKVRFSLEHDIAWGVSVDGPQATHDRFRLAHNGEGSHARFARALQEHPQFVERCGALTTITSANAGELLSIARYVRDLGLASWDWTLFQPIGRGRDDARFGYDLDTLVQAWAELFDAVESGEFDGFPVKPVLEYLDNFVDGPGANMCKRSDCGAARELLSVSHDGTVEACDCIDPTSEIGGLGKLETEGLAACRASAKASRIRSREPERLECGECLWQGVCGGTCLAHAGGVEEIWLDACALSLQAFDRISASLANSSRLLDYRNTLP